MNEWKEYGEVWGGSERFIKSLLPAGLMLKLKFQNFGHLMRGANSLEKTLMERLIGKIEGRRRRGRQDEMVGWHHRLNRHESEQTPGVGDGQSACSPWSCRVRRL